MPQRLALHIQADERRILMLSFLNKLINQPTDYISKCFLQQDHDK